MSDSAHDDRIIDHGEAASPSSKERLIGLIKHNFRQEAQRCRQRIRNGAEETPSVENEAAGTDDKLRRLKRRCAKLERKLQEKDAEIQELQGQQQMQFPLLMHETMCSLHSLGTNESDRLTSTLPLSHSVISDKAHERRDTDTRIHEYERQIAELYEENQQEKLKNEMLSECLRDQKHAKAKLVKACKHAKQELQAAKDSGLSQMLMDIEARCDALEKDKNQLKKELRAERAVRSKQEAEQDALAKQLEELLSESAKWEDIVARINHQLQRSREQVCEQQLTIENLNGDLKIADQRIARPPEVQVEIEQLKCAVSVERAKTENAQQDLHKITTKNDKLREQLATQAERRLLQNNVDVCVAQVTSDKVLTQVRFIQRKLRALTDLIQTYGDTNSIDMNLLDEGRWFIRDPVQEVTIQSCEENALQLSGGIQEAVCNLSELQQVVEEVCARLMGSTCALQ